MPVARKVPILPEGAARAVHDSPYDPDCRCCARLVAFLDVVRSEQPSYFCGPVPPFGVSDPELLIVGLAPGLHGANATGRPFTGDHAGILLYSTLHAYGYASSPLSQARDDGLALSACRITNAVKCLPPDNRPLPAEIRACNGYLAADLARLRAGGAVLALGRIAHDATLRALGIGAAAAPFAHGARHPLPRRALLIDSFHCSRYNTQTRRLTEPMFRAVFDAIAEHLGRAGARRAA
jgi:uracil-DNA glycosylase family 4